MSATAAVMKKVVTVNRNVIVANADKIYYNNEAITKAPIEIQVFRKGQKTELVTAMSVNIKGEVSIQYDPDKFTAPEGCGSAVKTPKAVWIETTGDVTYTDIKGKTHTV